MITKAMASITPKAISTFSINMKVSDEAYDSVLRHGKLRFSFFLAF